MQNMTDILLRLRQSDKIINKTENYIAPTKKKKKVIKTDKLEKPELTKPVLQ